MVTKTRFRSVYDDLDHPSLAIRLTLIMLLLHGGATTVTAMELRILCGAMLLFPPLSRDRTWWFFVFVVLVADVFTNRAFADNHKYLMTFWVLACLLTASQQGVRSHLAWNARILVALTFALATLWKTLSLEYFDGTFWEFTLLTDPRLEQFTVFVGHLTRSELAANRATVEGLLMAADGSLSSSLHTGPGMPYVVGALSWGGLLLEGGVALAFALGMRHRDVLLMSFILGTYVILPVLGFAFVLCVLGFTQAQTKWLKMCYLGVLAAVQLTSLPWIALVV